MSGEQRSERVDGATERVDGTAERIDGVAERVERSRVVKGEHDKRG